MCDKQAALSKKPPEHFTTVLMCVCVEYVTEMKSTTHRSVSVLQTLCLSLSLPLHGPPFILERNISVLCLFYFPLFTLLLLDSSFAAIKVTTTTRGCHLKRNVDMGHNKLLSLLFAVIFSGELMILISSVSEVQK